MQPAVAEALPPAGSVWDVNGGSLVSGAPNLTDAVAVSAGEVHCLSLKSDGTVWAWGGNPGNRYGELGDGTTTMRFTAAQVFGVADVIAVAAGEHHSLALKSDGTVSGWGDNQFGQLGDSSAGIKTTPVQIAALTNITAIAGGRSFSLALNADGTVWAWGDNTYGELGNDSGISSATPLQIANLSGVTAIAAGDRQAYALKTDGTVWSWGRNNYGQLGDGTTTDRKTPVQIAALGNTVVAIGGPLALKADGTVWKWGIHAESREDVYDFSEIVYSYITTPVQVDLSDAGRVVAIAGASTGRSLAVQDDGTVWSWGVDRIFRGSNDHYSVPIPVATWKNGVIGLAGGYYALVLAADGLPDTTPLLTFAAPAGGNYNLPVSVSFVANEPATFHYTVDGTDPKTSPTARLFIEPIYIAGPTTLKFYAVDNGGNIKSTRTENYVIANFPGLDLKRPGRSGTVLAWERGWYYMGGDGITPPNYQPVLVPGQLNVVAISGGSNHAVSLKTNGTVWAWGGNYFGELGDGTTTDSTLPVQVVGLSDIVALSAGLRHSLALKSDGSVWGWGYNSSGQLGNGKTMNRSAVVQVQGLLEVTAISAGTGFFSLALRADKTVWGWGSGPGINSLTPVQIPGLSDVKAIVAGSEQAFALKSDGTVWSWGKNNYGQLGDGTIIDRNTPAMLTALGSSVVAIGDQLALKADGTAWKWGSYASVYGFFDNTANYVSYNTAPVPVELASVQSISGGNTALKEDGTVWYWGSDLIYSSHSNDHHSIPVKVPSVIGAISMAGGNANIYIVATGDLSDTTPPVSSSTVAGGSYDAPLSVSLSANETSSIYFTTDGSDPRTSPTVKVFTEPVYIPSTTALNYFAMDIVGNSEVVKTENYTIIVSSSHDLLRPGTSGTVMAWGDNAWGQLGDGTTLAKSAPVPVAGMTNVVAVSAGPQHSLALKSDGTVWAWGDNYNGFLGDGTNISRPAPVQVSGLTDVVAIAAGNDHSLALKSDGTVWSWGENRFGQLGDGLSRIRTIPVQVTVLSNITAISAGSFFSLALKADGTVWSWGTSLFGQLGRTTTNGRIPARIPDLSGVTAITAGRNYQGFALKSDGSMWSWGEYGYFSSTLTRITELGNAVVAIGDNLALKTDGTVWKRGVFAFYDDLERSYISQNSTFVPVGLTNVVTISGSYYGSVTQNCLALKGDSTIWSWGLDHIVNGSNDHRSIPVQAPGLTGVISMAAGSFHSLAVTATGHTDTIFPITLATPASGTYYAPQSVSLSANEAATIYYTIDGSDPKVSPTVQTFSAAIHLPASATLKYYARDVAGNSESVKIHNYVISSWHVNTFNQTATSWIDWPAAQYGPVSTGSYLQVGGLVYYVFQSNSASWNGSGFYSARLQQCDQTTGQPLSDSSTAQPKFADMSGSAGLNMMPLTSLASSGGATLQSVIHATSGTTPVNLFSYITSLAAAYSGVAEGASATFTLPSRQYVENVVFDKSCAVEIKGGYDNSFNTIIGETKVQGSFTIQKGSLTADGITIL